MEPTSASPLAATLGGTSSASRFRCAPGIRARSPSEPSCSTRDTRHRCISSADSRSAFRGASRRARPQCTSRSGAGPVAHCLGTSAAADRSQCTACPACGPSHPFRLFVFSTRRAPAANAMGGAAVPGWGSPALGACVPHCGQGPAVRGPGYGASQRKHQVGGGVFTLRRLRVRIRVPRGQRSGAVRREVLRSDIPTSRRAARPGVAGACRGWRLRRCSCSYFGSA